jgi:hypothetical protein
MPKREKPKIKQNDSIKPKKKGDQLPTGVYILRIREFNRSSCHRALLSNRTLSTRLSWKGIDTDLCKLHKKILYSTLAREI